MVFIKDREVFTVGPVGYRHNCMIDARVVEAAVIYRHQPVGAGGKEAGYYPSIRPADFILTVVAVIQRMSSFGDRQSAIESKPSNRAQDIP
jgi:hypothetical protein